MINSRKPGLSKEYLRVSPLNFTIELSEVLWFGGKFVENGPRDPSPFHKQISYNAFIQVRETVFSDNFNVLERPRRVDDGRCIFKEDFKRCALLNLTRGRQDNHI